MDDAGQPGATPEPGPAPNVSLADAAVASAIARAAAEGRAADRAPTLEQLLAAFGEAEATSAVRRRVADALDLAGVGIEPDLSTAAPGQRLALSTSDARSQPSRNRLLTAAYALLAVVIVLGTAFAVSRLLGDDDQPVSAVLTDATVTVQPPATTGPASTATATAPATTAPPTGEETSTTSTATAQTGNTTTEEPKAEPKPKPRPATPTTVVVRVQAPDRGTFLCADNGRGTILFNGTLTGKRTFKGRRVRLNVGLATTQVTVNGKPLKIEGSPAGFDITRKSAKPLALGDRPCA